MSLQRAATSAWQFSSFTCFMESSLSPPSKWGQQYLGGGKALLKQCSWIFHDLEKLTRAGTGEDNIYFLKLCGCCRVVPCREVPGLAVGAEALLWLMGCLCCRAQLPQRSEVWLPERLVERAGSGLCWLAFCRVSAEAEISVGRTHPAHTLVRTHSADVWRHGRIGFCPRVMWCFLG